MKKTYFMTDEQEAKRLEDLAKFNPPQPQRFTYGGRVKALEICLRASLDNANKTADGIVIDADSINKITYHYEKFYELLTNKDKENKFSKEMKLSHVQGVMHDIIEEWKVENNIKNLDTNKIISKVDSFAFKSDTYNEDDLSL